MRKVKINIWCRLGKILNIEVPDGTEDDQIEQLYDELSDTWETDPQDADLLDYGLEVIDDNPEGETDFIINELPDDGDMDHEPLTPAEPTTPAELAKPEEPNVI